MWLWLLEFFHSLLKERHSSAVFCNLFMCALMLFTQTSSVGEYHFLIHALENGHWGVQRGTFLDIYWSLTEPVKWQASRGFSEHYHINRFFRAKLNFPGRHQCCLKMFFYPQTVTRRLFLNHISWIVRRSLISPVKWPVHNHLLLCFVSFDICISYITVILLRVLSFIPFIPHSLALGELSSSSFLSWHRWYKCSPTCTATGPSDGASPELYTALAREAESQNLIACTVMNW